MREDIISTSVLPELPFNITLAGTSYCDGSYYIRRDNSDSTCVEYIISGCGVVNCDQLTVYPTEGDIYLLPEGCNQEYYSDRENPWTKIWFNAHGPLVQHLLAAYGLSRKIHFPSSGGEEFIRRVHRICSEGLPPYEMQSRCGAVFFELIQLLANESEYTEIPGDAAIIKDYIERNAAQPIVLDELAALISRSVSQTIRIFKKAYGVTPYEYLLNQKLERAKLMLKSTNMRVKDISEALSFSDEHYFSGLFRKKTGIPPGEYRKQ